VTLDSIGELPNGSIFGEEEAQVVRRVLASDESISWGADSELFEVEFAAAVGAKHAVSFSCCTAALDACVDVLALVPGDEVVATTQTYWATIAALVRRGVNIRFADVADDDTLDIDVSSVERAITPKTRAIYVVHYGGNPARLVELRAIADAKKLTLVEDAAHAPGARLDGAPIGSGSLCCFSFASQKNMTTLGEGGMLTTSDPEIARRAKALAWLGVLGDSRPRSGPFGAYERPARTVGWNAAGDASIRSAAPGATHWDRDWSAVRAVGTKAYLSSIQAAVGRVQLAKLPAMNAARARIAARYTEGLRRIPGLRPQAVHPGAEPSWHLYTCFVDRSSKVSRDRLLAHLESEHRVVATQRYWPLHLNAALRLAGHGAGECPVAERLWFEEQLALPIHPSFDDAKIDRVLTALEAGMRALRSER
jgi:perosamine synthetase